jgi:hypothetical protein
VTLEAQCIKQLAGFPFCWLQELNGDNITMEGMLILSMLQTPVGRVCIYSTDCSTKAPLLMSLAMQR